MPHGWGRSIGPTGESYIGWKQKSMCHGNGIYLGADGEEKHAGWFDRQPKGDYNMDETELKYFNPEEFVTNKKL